ncbi:DUF4381 family protein [Methylococcus sp. EFPC2]|uniref:DUF4381 family protein n=1 Tax=Methylococcus sp. EFPC2 TaxID=2812648 RepID=UPI0019680D5E|nr:DUF4381 family protein [Methylococcus sp. EFPC2]QSA96097.1 DUF4381 family protein [Methylococcus sp. EFPC2]
MNPDLPLRDIHLPPPISWWPPAPGWWWLAASVTGLCLLGLWLLWRRRMPALRAAALRELAAISESEAPAAEKLRLLAVLLRRVCLVVYPPERVAGLSGAAWLAWLAEASGDPRFSEGAGRLLLESPYRRECDTDPAELIALCRSWFRRLPRRIKRGAKPR